MNSTNYASVDEYIAAQPEPAAERLREVRKAIRKALPKADEVISYRMPAYRLNGDVLLYFAGWKRHYSLYPASALLVDAFRAELASYEVTKGTIRFPLSEPVPSRLIADIARFRVKEMAEREKRGKQTAARTR
ncbi:MAG TPA: DUF1801 domain-containing protein [Acidobacteriaceae bacterium]|jgi:uncharacterized protein YdhG (YjbR/CyaY superfamily)|nr:DUF1801 domain-containing protein [Acidobacteriaceae bacterium]